MGRILLIAAVVVAALFLAGWLFGLILGALKWVLILGALAAVGYGLLKLTGAAKSTRPY